MLLRTLRAMWPRKTPMMGRSRRRSAAPSHWMLDGLGEDDFFETADEKRVRLAKVLSSVEKGSAFEEYLSTMGDGRTAEQIEALRRKSVADLGPGTDVQAEEDQVRGP